MYARNRIISLRNSGKKITAIRNILEEEGIKTSRSAVSLFLSRYRKTGRVNDAPRRGRRPKLTEEELTAIDGRMRQNDEMTSRELKRDCNLNVSEATIRRARRKLGWLCEKTKYCQFVREANKAKRLTFCLEALAVKDKFTDTIFTDESTIQVEQYARISFRKKGDQPKRKGRPKHPLKVFMNSIL